MAKYNIKEKKEKKAAYRTYMNPDVKDDLYEKIRNKIVLEAKYKDKAYSARQLASDLATNVRYISAVCADRFHMNYCELVNSYRINEAMSILADRRYAKLRMEDVSEMVGFSNRQSFYSAFFKLQGKTPRQYRKEFLKVEPASEKKQGRRGRPAKQAV